MGADSSSMNLDRIIYPLKEITPEIPYSYTVVRQSSSAHYADIYSLIIPNSNILGVFLHFFPFQRRFLLKRPFYFRFIRNIVATATQLIIPISIAVTPIC